ncbi:MAG: ferritin-like domain-containing protein [Myxococcota bacterium]
MARSLEETNPRGAKVLHAAGYWLGRYWNEEEAHHEVAYGALLDELCLDPIPDEDVMSHRGMFPRDNFLRNLVLQACVEIEVSITYANAAKTTDNPMIREIFLQIMRDEVQHRQYFVAFAQALVDAGVYPAKDALAMAFHWIKPGGELYGSTRSAQSSRDGYVNWWEMTRTGDDDVAVTDDQHFDERILSQKRTSVLKVASQSTRTHYDSVAGLKKAYLRALAPRPELVAGVSP